MNLYRQPIALFGIVLPVIAAAGVAGLGIFLKGKMTVSFEVKKSTYKTYEAGRRAALELEKEVSLQRPALERWDSQLSQETASTVTSNLREISAKLPSKEIQLSAFEPSGKGGFGAVSPQKSSQVRIALRGTFRTVQKAFLELETRMPQLQLQDLKIDPASTQSALLNFQVSYTAWESDSTAP
jgi:hypothetical protein